MSPLAFPFEPLFAQFTILVEQARQRKFGGIGRQIPDIDLLHNALWKAALNFPDVVLEPPDNNFVPVLRSNRNAAAETLRIQDL